MIASLCFGYVDLKKLRRGDRIWDKEKQRELKYLRYGHAKRGYFDLIALSNDGTWVSLLAQEEELSQRFDRLDKPE